MPRKETPGHPRGAFAGPHRIAAVISAHRLNPRQRGAELEIGIRAETGRQDSGLLQRLHREERESAGDGLLQTAVGILVQPAQRTGNRKRRGADLDRRLAERQVEVGVRGVERGASARFDGVDHGPVFGLPGRAHREALAAPDDRAAEFQFGPDRHRAGQLRRPDRDGHDPALPFGQLQLAGSGGDRFERPFDGDAPVGGALCKLVVETGQRELELILRRDRAGSGDLHGRRFAQHQLAFGGTGLLLIRSDRHQQQRPGVVWQLQLIFAAAGSRHGNGPHRDDRRSLQRGGERRQETGELVAAADPAVHHPQCRIELPVGVAEAERAVDFAEEELPRIGRLPVGQRQNAPVHRPELQFRRNRLPREVADLRPDRDGLAGTADGGGMKLHIEPPGVLVHRNPHEAGKPLRNFRVVRRIGHHGDSGEISPLRQIRRYRNLDRIPARLHPVGSDGTDAVGSGRDHRLPRRRGVEGELHGLARLAGFGVEFKGQHRRIARPFAALARIVPEFGFGQQVTRFVRDAEREVALLRHFDFATVDAAPFGNKRQLPRRKLLLKLLPLIVPAAVLFDQPVVPVPADQDAGEGGFLQLIRLAVRRHRRDAEHAAFSLRPAVLQTEIVVAIVAERPDGAGDAPPRRRSGGRDRDDFDRQDGLVRQLRDLEAGVERPAADLAGAAEGARGTALHRGAGAEGEAAPILRPEFRDRFAHIQGDRAALQRHAEIVVDPPFHAKRFPRRKRFLFGAELHLELIRHIFADQKTGGAVTLRRRPVLAGSAQPDGVGAGRRPRRNLHSGLIETRSTAGHRPGTEELPRRSGHFQHQRHSARRVQLPGVAQIAENADGFTGAADAALREQKRAISGLPGNRQSPVRLAQVGAVQFGERQIGHILALNRDQQRRLVVGIGQRLKFDLPESSRIGFGFAERLQLAAVELHHRAGDRTVPGQRPHRETDLPFTGDRLKRQVGQHHQPRIAAGGVGRGNPQLIHAGNPLQAERVEGQRDTIAPVAGGGSVQRDGAEAPGTVAPRGLQKIQQPVRVDLRQLHLDLAGVDRFDRQFPDGAGNREEGAVAEEIDPGRQFGSDEAGAFGPFQRRSTAGGGQALLYRELVEFARLESGGDVPAVAAAVHIQRQRRSHAQELRRLLRLRRRAEPDFKAGIVRVIPGRENPQRFRGGGDRRLRLRLRSRNRFRRFGGRGGGRLLPVPGIELDGETRIEGK